jgi:hypothetical protein
MTMVAGTEVELLLDRAPGDDLFCGTAASFEVRYSESPIEDESDFAAATEVPGVVPPAGSRDGGTVAFESAAFNGKSLYFAFATADEAGNRSGLTTLPLVQFGITTPTDTPTPTATSEATSTATPTLEATATSTSEPTATPTPTSEATETATTEPTATATSEATETATPTTTSTIEPTATVTSEATATSTPTSEATATSTTEATATSTAEATATSTIAATATSTRAATPTPTATRNPSSTSTAEPTDTATAVPPTPTATLKGGAVDDDGCQIVPRQDDRGPWWLGLAPLLWIGARRRRLRDHSGG